MDFKDLCILVLWTKVASALEGLILDTEGVVSTKLLAQNSNFLEFLLHGNQ